MSFVRFFIWVGVLAAILFVWTGAGSPYVIWSYSFRDNGDPNNPFAERYYTSCTCTNFRASITVPAEAGHCGWVRFFSERDAR